MESLLSRLDQLNSFERREPPIDLGFKVRSGKVEGTLAFVPTDALEVDRFPLGPKHSFVWKNDLVQVEEKFLKPKAALDGYLLHASQKLIERDYDILSLPLIEPTNESLPLLVDYERDPKTGRITGYEQKPPQGASDGKSSKMQTAQNSTSLQRLPDQRADFTRGASRNMPFMFEGMGLGSLADGKSDDEQQPGLNLNLNEELLTVAPGLPRGLFGFSTTTGDRKEELSLVDIFSSENDDILVPLASVSENKAEKTSTKAQDEAHFDLDQALLESVKESEPIDAIIGNLKTLRINSSLEEKQTSTKRTFAHMIDTTIDIPQETFEEIVPELAKQFPFQLDIFQKYAVFHLEKGDSVFIAAHTSAGKTVVAEYAIALAQKHMTRTIYTSPIKALSNQKFRDFRTTFGDDEIGLLTGDVQIRPEAPCVIMTTEILRSMLYRGADMIRDVEFVIFDEVHYINDIERGVVWEEVIIMLPPQVNIVLLSATVPNTYEFADWVGRTKKKNVYVISTQKRPVPLEHYLFPSNSVPANIFKIVDASKQFVQDGYKKAWDAAHATKIDKTKPSKPGHKAVTQNRNVKFGAPSSSATSFYQKQDRNTWSILTGLLRKKELLPVVIFTFSKKRCEEYADTLTNLDLLTATEKSEVHVFIERSLVRLKGTDKELPQILRMRSLLGRGIGVHHGGLLPIVKELVEILFARNLIRVLFATETFAMGVNMPAKCVVFSGIRKHDGRQFRELLSGEYTQMSGRAGRRGLDETGVVIITCSGDDFTDASLLQTMILGQPTKLESQFRLTYNMILNLLRVEAFRIEDMMKRSFYEDETQRQLPEKEKILKQQQEKLAAAPRLSCTICSHDIDDYYRLNTDIVNLNQSMWEIMFLRSTSGQKLMTPGRLVVINEPPFRNAIAAVLRANQSDEVSADTRDRFYWCFVLTDSSAKNELQTSNIPLPMGKISFPNSQNLSHQLVRVRWNHFVAILDHKISEDMRAVMNKNSEITVRLTNELYDYCRKIFDGSVNTIIPLPEIDYLGKIKDFEFKQKALERFDIVKKLVSFKCIRCPDLEEHYAVIHERASLMDSLAQLQFRISDRNLTLLPDYHQRIKVLKTLKYVDENGTVQLKGRVACEINSGESLVLTELVVENLFANLEVNTIAALLSAFVFQEKSEIKTEVILTRMSAEFQDIVESIRHHAVLVAEVQRQAGLDVSVEDFLSSTLNFGLAEVVYEWASGTPFKSITDLTDVLEGSIVRTITRLDELCREVRDAARIVGNANLYRLMDEVSAVIKRDIVFAASLYV